MKNKREIIVSFKYLKEMSRGERGSLLLVMKQRASQGAGSRLHMKKAVLTILLVQRQSRFSQKG